MAHASRLAEAMISYYLVTDLASAILLGLALCFSTSFSGGTWLRQLQLYLALLTKLHLGVCEGGRSGLDLLESLPAFDRPTLSGEEPWHLVTVIISLIIPIQEV